MDLLVDIGNTRLKWAWLDRGCLSQVHRVEHQGDLWGAAEKIWAQGDCQPDRIFVASVLKREVDSGLGRWIKRTWSLEPAFMQAQQDGFGITNAYEQPTQLGVDRWLALIAVHYLYAGSSLIVDCGTAVTCDLVDSEGKHLGGLIVPGLAMMRHSLEVCTDIPALTDVKSGRGYLLGNDTSSGVAHGAVQAITGLIERVLRKIESILGAAPIVILAGGDAAIIQQELDYEAELREDLVIEGLKYVAEGT